MTPPLRLLIVDDSDDDVVLLLNALHLGGYEIIHEVVDTPAAMQTALERQDWDVIISDHAMPQFSAPAALTLARSLYPSVPFIIVSGEIDLNLAVSLIKAGAQDYIQKRELARLVPVIERELREIEARRERHRAERSLQVSENRYRRLFETARDGILILDVETGQIIDVNPFLMEILGYSQGDFIGKKLWEIGPFKDIDASRFAYDQLSSTGYVRYEDLPLEASDGHRVQVEFVSNVYLVDDLKVAQCNIRDITARKQAEKELTRLNNELEQRVHERTLQLELLNQELESFNYSVSHDLRAPLCRISGFVEALWEDHTNKQNDKSLHLMQRIRASVHHMNELIEALLVFAQSFSSALERQAVDLSALVRLIVAELQQSDPARQVECICVADITVNGDANLLRIVMENLLGNAWKFTAGRISARIAFGIAPQADGSVAYFVRDNGVGFDMAYTDKLFTPFQRLHNQPAFAGSGVGLATVQRIIHRHGGKIWADSDVDKGATFYFTIGGALQGQPPESVTTQ